MGVPMRGLRDCSMCALAKTGRKNSGGEAICNSNSIEHQEEFDRYGTDAAQFCGGFISIEDSLQGVIQLDGALKFMLAGKSEFTVVSGKTGTRLGFRLEKRKSNRDGGADYIYYMSTLQEGKMVYAGIIYLHEQKDRFWFAKGKKGRLEYNHVNVKSILYILNNLYEGNTGMNIRIYHVGTCGRCGRKLTTPESIVNGIGPECAKKVGIPRIKVKSRNFK